MSDPQPNAVLRHARRVVVAVCGVSCILVGVVLLFIPGPGTVAIVAGLGLLATEFVWARRWLRLAKEHAERAARRALPSEPAAPRERAPDPSKDPQPSEDSEPGRH